MRTRRLDRRGGPIPAGVEAIRARRHRTARRALLALVVAAALLLGGHSGAVAHEGQDEPLPVDTGADLRPVYEVPAGADRIIGSPEAGPKPQQSGDRGGSLQFATLGAVAAAVGFIMWRIARAVRRASHHAPAASSGCPVG